MSTIRSYRIMIAAAIAVTLGCLAVGAVLDGAEFYMAATGKDTGPGTKEQPLATLEAARDAARNAKAGPHRIVLMPGEYFLDKPLALDARDNGLTIEAGTAGLVTLHGGRRITGLQRDAQGLWTARVPEVQGRPWRFEQLYVNGRRTVRARTPNRFYFYMNAPRRASIDPATGQPRKPDDRTFLASAEDIAPLLALPSERLRDVVVASYHSWHVSRQYVASVQPGMNAVFLTGSCGVPFFTYTQNVRCFLENYREALDAPGEWFLDRDGVLSYHPLPEDDLRTAEVVAPVTDTLLQFAGVEDRPVANITVRGLKLAYGGYQLPPEGESSPQAACKIPAVVMADYARGITLEDSTIEHTGTYGVWFRDGCRDCSVQRCLLQDLGAGGVRVGQTGPDPKPAERTSHIRIDDNMTSRRPALRFESPPGSGSSATEHSPPFTTSTTCV